jgi:hypothetical protein
VVIFSGVTCGDIKRSDLWRYSAEWRFVSTGRPEDFSKLAASGDEDHAEAVNPFAATYT